MTDEKKTPFGGTVKVTIGKRAKPKPTAEDEERHYGPPPIGEDARRLPPPIHIIISDISTLFLQTNINETSVTAEDTGIGWAVVGRQLPTNRGGDTYGDSLVEFTEATVLQSNENILRALDSGGGG
jgi:hypothetical protein